MDPIKFNHDMQIFRNKVKVAQKHVIMKLVRDVKFWKTKLEKDSGNERAKKKVDADLALMDYLKPIIPIELAKSVLLWNPENQQRKMTTEEKACHKIYSYKKLGKDARAMISNFDLKKNEAALVKFSSNKDKVKKPKAAKKLKKKEKTVDGTAKVVKKSKSQKQTVKEVATKEDEIEESEDNEAEIAMDSETTEQIVKNIKTTKMEVVVDEEEDEEGGEGEEDYEGDDCVEDDEDEEDDEGEEDEEDEIADEEQEESEAEEEEEAISLKPVFKKNSIHPPYAPKEGYDDDDEDDKSPKLPNMPKKPTNKKVETEEVEIAVPVQDSFFITRQGKSYVALAPVRDLKKEEEIEDLFNKKKRKFNQLQAQDYANNNPKWNESQEDRPQSWATKQKPTNIPNNRRMERGENNDILHPSWAAKNKEKGIKQFEGTKINFGDDSTVKSKSESLHPSWAAKQKPNNIPNNRRMEKGENDILHPSWAAKNKEKGIKQFQGTKISFGDDSTVISKPAFTSKSESESLHPSWAAKQKQKGIKEFAGTKIKFEADSTTNPKAFGPSTQKNFKEFSGTKTKVQANATPMDISSEQLHPSWAAKQKEKGIKKFQGTKINFNDDD